MRDDTFDPAPAPASVTAEAARRAGPIRRKRRTEFVRVPLEWAHRLNRARRVATSKVALHLLRENFETHKDTITLANNTLTIKGVSRKEKRRALEELEGIGLARIERRPRRSPRVTLLFLEGGQ
jgi:hypothetical protein